jgi:hypothetical protein
MLTKEDHSRVEQQVKNVTAGYKRAKSAGYSPSAVGVPSFNAQEDHDRYHPDDAGQAFSEHNEFASEVTKRLISNGVPAELVVVKYADYARWLNGRKHTGETRAEYNAHLVADAHTKWNNS